MKQQYLIILFLFPFLFLTSCENVLDCIINVRPELNEKTLAIGEVETYYSEVITAEIKNENQDNAYDYYFDVSGEIPEGLDVFFNRHREVVIKGTPTEPGRFNFEVFLEVVPHYDEFQSNDRNGPLCTDTTTKTYTLFIRK